MPFRQHTDTSATTRIYNDGGSRASGRRWSASRPHRNRARRARRFRRAASTMDSDVRVIDESMDATPLDTEPEVIELDSSCETVATPCRGNENPICGTKSAGRVPSPDGVETTIYSEQRSPQSARSSDVAAPRPVFKVMFRDESVSRYVLLYRFGALFTTRVREFVPPGCHERDV